MPYLTKPIIARGAVIDILVGLSAPAIRWVRESGKPIPQPVRLEALIDTGAVITCIDHRTIQSLELPITGSVKVAVPRAGGSLTCDQYNVSLELLHPLKTQFNLVLPTITVTDAQVRETGADALIGCDLLRKWQFLFDGPAGTFRLDY